MLTHQFLQLPKAGLPVGLGCPIGSQLYRAGVSHQVLALLVWGVPSGPGSAVLGCPIQVAFGAGQCLLPVGQTPFGGGAGELRTRSLGVGPRLPWGRGVGAMGVWGRAPSKALGAR